MLLQIRSNENVPNVACKTAAYRINEATMPLVSDVARFDLDPNAPIKQRKTV